MSGQTPELSVLIPCHEGAHRLPETLKALGGNGTAADRVEVIICDDGSAHAVPPEIGREFTCPVTVLRLPTNQGRAAACNLALSQARGRIVLMLDDDMSAAEGLIEKHIEAHPAGQPPQAIIGRIDTDPAYFKGRFGRFLAQQEEQRSERLLAAREKIPFTHCLTGHFSIPRQSLLDLGGYNEQFSRYGFEDIELAWRIDRAGLPLVYEDELQTTHRSEQASFQTHCMRHIDAGAMAVLFSAEAMDPEVDRFLRIKGMPWREQHTTFRKMMAFYHGMARRCPTMLLPLLLGSARIKVELFAGLLPTAWLHVSFHIVRDMHYAAGIVLATRSQERNR